MNTIINPNEPAPQQICRCQGCGITVLNGHMLLGQDKAVAFQESLAGLVQAYGIVPVARAHIALVPVENLQASDGVHAQEQPQPEPK